MVENVFVVGLDDHNAGILHRLPDAGRYRFHPLLSVDELLYRDTIPVPDLLEEAQRQLDSFDGRVDAIIGFWDFPVSTMVPTLYWAPSTMSMVMTTWALSRSTAMSLRSTRICT